MFILSNGTATHVHSLLYHVFWFNDSHIFLSPFSPLMLLVQRVSYVAYAYHDG